MRLSLIVASAALLTIACTHRPIQIPWSPPPAPASIETPPPVEYVRGDSSDWGVALSGGGVRSAMFSVGVLKALYDAGVLDEVDVISSVSGGGYASYWLYRSHLNHPDQRFGSTVFDSAVFGHSVCMLQARGNFHTVRETIRGLATGSSFEGYQHSIQNSFGMEDRPGADLALGAAGNSIRTGRAPFFIVNATMYGSTAPMLHRGIEITPDYIGSPSRGYARYDGGGAAPLGWSEAITASAAALSPLRRALPRASSDAGEPAEMIWDGGQHENLGALALIRRRIENIVIVDAEHDPDFTFGAYERLRHLLRDEGIEFSVPGIDEFIGEVHIGAPKRKVKDRPRYGTAPVAEGTVRFPDGRESRVFYLKMSISDSLVAVLRNELDTHADSSVGRAIIDSARVLTKAARDRSTGRGRCATLVDYPQLSSGSRFVFDVANYADYITNSWKLRPLRLIRFVRYDFPHVTTVDQSYYTDQTAAVIGLGFLQASSYNWRNADRPRTTSPR